MPPKIYKSLDKLKPKLRQYEPHLIQRRIGHNVTVVFAVNQLKFNPKIPILEESAFIEEDSDVEDDECRLSETSSESESDIEIPRRKHSPPRKHAAKQVEVRNVFEEIVISESDDDAIAERVLEQSPREEDCMQSGIDLRVDEDEEDTVKDIPNEDEYIETEQSVDSVERLVVTGPEEDEFRKYADDDDEDESVISKNLKKIRCDPPAPPPIPPKPQVRYAQPFQQAPRQNLNPSPQKTKSVPDERPRPEPPKQTEFTVGDINKLLEQKQLRLVYVELNRRKEQFKLDEAARTILRKAVSSCFEQDDTFTLLDLVKLVFEFNFQSDAKLWDELIGKLKRKDNPHAKVLKFRCQVDPTLVSSNYNRIFQMIVEHFNATNPTVALPWHTIRYLFEKSQKSNKCPPALAKPMNEVITPAPKPAATVRNGCVAQENRDPVDEQRRVRAFRDNDGKPKFKITIPKRSVKQFEERLLI